MPLEKKLNRTLRAAEEDSDSEEYYEVTDRSSPSIIDTGDGADIISSGSEDEEDDGAQEEEEEASEDSNEDQYEARLSKVSFGALAKAQESLSKEQASRKRKRGDGASASQEDKLQALRERLRALKADKLAASPNPKSSKKTKTSEKASTKANPTKDVEDESDATDGGSSDSDGAPFARSSKHAPRIQSSKRAVTRKRTAVEVKKPVFRDPRFDQLSGVGPNETTLKNRYSFLDDYRASEMADLRATIKKSKNEAEKAQLKRQLLSMESQQKAREAKDKQQEIVQKHRKEEKELIKQGKQPFYLKKAEQKKLALIDRFQNMKSKQRAHVIERRRKKTTAKERKNIPADRRAA